MLSQQHTCQTVWIGPAPWLPSAADKAPRPSATDAASLILAALAAGGSTTKELQDKTRLGKAHINRTLARLISRGLLDRERRKDGHIWAFAYLHVEDVPRASPGTLTTDILAWLAEHPASFASDLPSSIGKHNSIQTTLSKLVLRGLVVKQHVSGGKRRVTYRVAP